MTSPSSDSLTPPSPIGASAATPSGAPPDHGERARVIELRNEAQATQDRTQKAALLYEAGYLTEAVLQQPAHAVQDYLAAYNSDSRSRLPLFSLLRMFERRSSYKNLARLYDAELRGARNPHEKTNALLDQACLDLVHEGDAQAAVARLQRALESDVAGEAALLLEWNRRAASDDEGARAALEARVQSCDDPLHRGVLLLELAAQREQAGELRRALEALRSAALGTPSHELFLVTLTRFARQHGFVGELVEASERRAELIAAELASGGELDDAHRERLRSRAVALWYEAARLRCINLADPQGALDALDKALAIRPDDLLLRRMRMIAFDQLEDRERAAGEARALLEREASGEDAAPLHFRLAEHALVTGDTERARASLVAALEASPSSLAADAILDDLLLDEGLVAERIEQRGKRAESAEADRARALLNEAAVLAAFELREPARSLALFQRAEERQAGHVETARTAYAAALVTGDPALTQFALDRMLRLELEGAERAALLHHAADVAASAEESRALLRSALEPTQDRAALAHVALARAAEARDFGLMSQAHELLATLSERDDEAALRLCAAARASVRAGDLTQARGLLERALQRDGGNPYANSLLEETLRRAGQGEQLIELLSRAAESQPSADGAEAALLTAALASEREGDTAKARTLLEDAAKRAPTSVSPLWCLLRLAERSDDAAAIAQTRARLAQLEADRNAEGLESLLACELLQGDAETRMAASDRLAKVLEHAQLAPHAAVALALARDLPDDVHERALEVLGAHASTTQRGLVQRELLSAALIAGAPHARVLDLCDELLHDVPEDPWGLFAKSSVPLPHDEDGHAATLLQLAKLTRDPQLRQALTAEALWTRRMVRTGPLADEQRELGKDADGLEFARVVVQTQSPNHEQKLRVLSLEKLLTEANGEERFELQLDLARTHLARGKAERALVLLEDVLKAAPDDACALELKRVAGRAAGDFRAVVDAAEALATQVDEELALTLLEESAMVRADELDDQAGAESLFARIVARSPVRQVAYARLHELLRDKPDSSELVTLVKARTEHVHEADELAKLFYELARLHRARGETDEALDAIDNVLMLEEHVGALALSAEIHTAREEWEEAVSALESMAAAAGVPKAQRKLCRLGAADFLEHRIKDPARALGQLEKLLEEGHGDLALQLRVAQVAERAQLPQRAHTALHEAARLAEDGQRVELLLRAARLARDTLGLRDESAAAFAEALTLEPLHEVALCELHALAPERAPLHHFETQLRAVLQSAPLEAAPLRKLRTWAELANEADSAFIALLALRVLDLANEQERRLCDAALATTARAAGHARLGTRELSQLCAPPLGPGYEPLLRTVLGAAVEIDQLEPSKFGVGRGQRVNLRDKSALRDELETIGGPLGLALHELYVGGPETARVTAIPHEDGVTLVLGADVTAPFSTTRRHQVALQLAAVHGQSLPLLSRSQQQSARLVWAALVAAECAPANQWPEAELGELPRTLARALPRKVRKALPELYRALPDQGRDMVRQCQLHAQHARRVALLIAGDLQASLDDALGAMATRDDIADSAAAQDLIRTWTSGPLAQLRKQLGLAK